MQKSTDVPVFDHGPAGARLWAERHDEPGNEDWHEPEEDEGQPEPRAIWGHAWDTGFNPEHPDLGTFKWNPTPPRGA
jgi:hypothetical protein